MENKLHVFMQCTKCGELGRKDIAAKVAPMEYRYPLRCNPDKRHGPESTDPSEIGAYTESIEDVIDAVAEGNDYTSELACAKDLALKVGSPFEISVETM